MIISRLSSLSFFINFRNVVRPTLFLDKMERVFARARASSIFQFQLAYLQPLLFKKRHVRMMMRLFVSERYKERYNISGQPRFYRLSREHASSQVNDKTGDMADSQFSLSSLSLHGYYLPLSSITFYISPSLLLSLVWLHFYLPWIDRIACVALTESGQTRCQRRRRLAQRCKQKIKYCKKTKTEEIKWGKWTQSRRTFKKMNE